MAAEARASVKPAAQQRTVHLQETLAGDGADSDTTTGAPLTADPSAEASHQSQRADSPPTPAQAGLATSSLYFGKIAFSSNLQLTEWDPYLPLILRFHN